MDYKLICEKLEEVRNIAEKSKNIILNDEVNKDKKLQLKVIDIIKSLSIVTNELNK